MVLLSVSGTITSVGNLIRGVITAFTGQTGPAGEPDLGVQTSFSSSITASSILALVVLGVSQFEVLFKGMFRAMFRRMR